MQTCKIKRELAGVVIYASARTKTASFGVVGNAEPLSDLRRSSLYGAVNVKPTILLQHDKEGRREGIICSDVDPLKNFIAAASQDLAKLLR